LGRRVEYASFRRGEFKRLLERLRNAKTADWPKYLKRASEVIANEQDQPEIARAITLDAVAIAYNYTHAINATAMVNARLRALSNLGDATARIFNCMKRIEAPIRKAFDQAAQSHFSDGVDSETIKAFLHECAVIAETHPENADAGRILAALGRLEVPEENFVSDASKMINDHEALHPQDRWGLQDSLKDLVANPNKVTALAVFKGVAAACAYKSPFLDSENKDANKIPLLESEIEDADVDAYIKEVASCWKRYGLRPAREYKLDGPPKHNHKYKSRFHRFAELVLIDCLDPGARTFEPTDHDVDRAQEIESRLPREVREKLIPPGHRDLISDHRIRQALADDSKNDD
jgi:hypothetical protein